MNKILLIDETGNFDDLKGSFVFGVVIEGSENIDKINDIIKLYLKQNNFTIYRLHNTEMSSEKQNEFVNFVKNQLSNCSISIIRNDTNYTMKYSDDQNYMMALENVLNYFVINKVERGEHIKIIIAIRYFGIRSTNELSMEERERYKNAMIENKKRWIDKYKKYKDIDINIDFGDFHKENYYCLSIPDIFCSVYKKNKLNCVNDIIIVPMRLSKFYDNLVTYGNNLSVFSEVEYISSSYAASSIQQVEEMNTLLGEIRKYVSTPVEVFRYILNEVEILGKYDNVYKNLNVLNNFKNIVSLISPNENDDIEKNLLTLYIDFLINRKRPLKLEDRISEDFEDKLNSSKLFNNLLDKLKFEIDFYLIYYLRRYFFNLYFPNSWYKKIDELISKIEILYEKSQINGDHYLAKLYGTLAQGYALCGEYKKAEEYFKKNYELLGNDEKNYKIKNFLYTFYWYYYEFYKNDYNNFAEKYFSTGQENDFYFILNCLRSVIISENNMIRNIDLNEIDKKIKNKKEEDPLLYFLTKKWIAINYCEKEQEQQSISLLEDIIKEIDEVIKQNSFFIYKLFKINIILLINKIKKQNDNFEEIYNSTLTDEDERERGKKIKIIEDLINKKYQIINLSKKAIYKLLPFYFS